jgi:hypothetical protein
VLLIALNKTRVGLIVQAALTHRRCIRHLGHNIDRAFMMFFGIGTALAELAGISPGLPDRYLDHLFTLLQHPARPNESVVIRSCGLLRPGRISGHLRYHRNYWKSRNCSPRYPLMVPDLSKRELRNSQQVGLQVHRSWEKESESTSKSLQDPKYPVSRWAITSANGF